MGLLQTLLRPSSAIIIVAFVYFLSAKGHVEVADTEFSIRTCQAILDRGSLAIDPVPSFTLASSQGFAYSKYGFGYPLYLLPYVMAGRVISWSGTLSEQEAVNLAVSFASIPPALVCLIMLDRIATLFGCNKNNRILLIVSFGLGTLAWRYSVYDFSEALQMALLFSTVYALLLGKARTLLAAGFVYGMLFLVKAVYLVLLPLFFIYLMSGSSPPSLRRRIALFFAPVGLAFTIWLALNLLRFGHPLESGYGGEASRFVLSQLWWTAPALMFSPSKGIFFFNPILLLSVAGWPCFLRDRPRDATLVLSLLFVIFLVSGAWWSWEGGWSWGPRLLVPSLPLWFLPATYVFRSASKPWHCYVIALTIYLSVALQVPGILVKELQVHHLSNMVLPAERRDLASDYRVACVMLINKLADGREVYRLTDFGLTGERLVDMSEFESFRGVNLWTEHVMRPLRLNSLRIVVAAFWVMLSVAVIFIVHHSLPLFPDATLAAPAGIHIVPPD